MSTTITCNLVISNFLSLLFFCFLLVNVVNNESHFGHLSSTHVNVLGHFPGNWSVSAASYPDTNLRTLVSGILEFFSRYSAVLLRYFCDKPQSSLCCSQSSSWKCQCHKIKKIHWNFLIQNNPKDAGHLHQNIRAVHARRSDQKVLPGTSWNSKEPDLGNPYTSPQYPWRSTPCKHCKLQPQLAMWSLLRLDLELRFLLVLGQGQQLISHVDISLQVRFSFGSSLYFWCTLNWNRG